MNEELLEPVQIRRLDVFSLFHDVAADATHFGFVDITASSDSLAPEESPGGLPFAPPSKGWVMGLRAGRLHQHLSKRCR
jgi:hypothetical protein